MTSDFILRKFLLVFDLSGETFSGLFRLCFKTVQVQEYSKALPSAISSIKKAPPKGRLFAL